MSRTFMTLMSVVLMAALAAVIIIVSSISGSAGTESESDALPVKYYQSIEIKAGDSLWSISERYASGYCSDIRDYVKEIKKINHLQSDRINEGMHLIVVTYDR